MYPIIKLNIKNNETKHKLQKVNYSLYYIAMFGIINYKVGRYLMDKTKYAVVEPITIDTIPYNDLLFI